MSGRRILIFVLTFLSVTHLNLIPCSKKFLKILIRIINPIWLEKWSMILKNVQYFTFIQITLAYYFLLNRPLCGTLDDLFLYHSTFPPVDQSENIIIKLYIFYVGIYKNVGHYNSIINLYSPILKRLNPQFDLKRSPFSGKQLVRRKFNFKY